MGVSENSVPLNPMVLLIIIPFLNGYFIGNIPNIFRQTHIPRLAVFVPKTQPNFARILMWDLLFGAWQLLARIRTCGNAKGTLCQHTSLGFLSSHRFGKGRISKVGEVLCKQKEHETYAACCSVAFCDAWNTGQILAHLTESVSQKAQSSLKPSRN